MKEKKRILWLMQEISGLTQTGLITPETRDKIIQHYQSKLSNLKNHSVFVAFSIIGSLLMGLGTILLIAHNWDHIDRPLKLALSLLPVISAQTAAFYVLIRKEESIAARESTGIYFFCAVGASIALVAQIYHISEDFSLFLMTWYLLTLPLVYVLNSAGTGVLCALLPSSWALNTGWGSESMWLFWPLFLLLIPAYIRCMRSDVPVLLSGLFSFIVCITIPFGLGLTARDIMPGFLLIAFAAFFSSMYILSEIFEEGPYYLSGIFHRIGLLGSAFIFYPMTFSEAWNGIKWENYHPPAWCNTLDQIMGYLLTFLLTALSTYLIWFLFRKKYYDKIAMGVLCWYAGAGFLLVSLGVPSMAIAVFSNLYIIALGLTGLIFGIREGNLSKTNTGLLILIGLICLRFFDSDLSLITRSVAFMVMGGIFLGFNLLLKRKGILKS